MWSKMVICIVIKPVVLWLHWVAACLKAGEATIWQKTNQTCKASSRCSIESLHGERFCLVRVLSNMNETCILYLSRDMTKPTKWLCAQRRLRSVLASLNFPWWNLTPCEKCYLPWNNETKSCSWANWFAMKLLPLFRAWKFCFIAISWWR